MLDEALQLADGQFVLPPAGRNQAAQEIEVGQGYSCWDCAHDRVGAFHVAGFNCHLGHEAAGQKIAGIVALRSRLQKALGCCPVAAFMGEGGLGEQRHRIPRLLFENAIKQRFGPGLVAIDKVQSTRLEQGRNIIRQQCKGARHIAARPLQVTASNGQLRIEQDQWAGIGIRGQTARNQAGCIFPAAKRQTGIGSNR